jgi:hypothetical protein
LHSIGREGNGPGEFINPSYLMAMNDEVVIFDRNAGKASTFGNDGEYIDEFSDSYVNPVPAHVCYYDTSKVIGGVVFPDYQSGEMGMQYIVGIFDLRFELLDTIYVNSFQYVPNDLSNTLRETSFSCSYVSDNAGKVFYAPTSTEEYKVYCYSSNVDRTVFIQEDYSPIRKNSDELAVERVRMTRVIQSRNQDISAVYEPNEFEFMIPPNGLHLDSRDRIWIERGIADFMSFDIYSINGDFINTVLVDGIDTIETEKSFIWWSVSKYGLLAFTYDPLDYPRVYVFDLPEID